MAVCSKGGADATQTAANASASPRTAEDQLIDASIPGCWMNGSHNQCSGHPKKPIDDPNESENHGKWAPSISTGAKTPPSTRPGGNVFVLSAVKDDSSLYVRRLDDIGTVVALIEANPKSPRDPLYGIGVPQTNPALKLQHKFFLVVKKFDRSGSAADNTDAIQLSTWSVWGIDVAQGLDKPRLVQVGNTGTFRMCRHPENHDVARHDLARFMRCSDIATWSGIEDRANEAKGAPNRSLYQAALTGPLGLDSLKTRAEWITRMRKRLRDLGVVEADIEPAIAILQTFDTAPAWMVCGLGCCAAEAT